jgi:hypothetical protein
MNWFPTPPTDNLYKFLAVLGAWGLLFVFGSFLILSYQNYEHEEFNKQLVSLSSEESWLRKAEMRLKSLEGNRVQDNAIPEISNHFSPKEELVFLSNAIALSKEHLSLLKERTKEAPKNVVPFLASVRFDLWLPGVAFVTFICFYIGFRQWLVLQRASDELLRLDLLLKKAELKEVSRSRFARSRSP